jgi:PhzF family phenazine biosynthesis protein
MTIELQVVDAFTDRPFSGNPAAVCVLKEDRPDAWLQKVASEMNLSETAYIRSIDGGFSLRWFTPRIEVQLCGHATLASAKVLWEKGILQPSDAARFHTLSGWLTCRRLEDGWIEMDFPAKVAEPTSAPFGLAAALGCDVLATASNGMDFLVEVADERTLRGLRPNFSELAKLPVRGVIVTCRSDSTEYDFVSRFFAPAAGIDEDPVTGSAHCALGPYWQTKLGRSGFTAYQASSRGGVVRMEVRGDRVFLQGQTVIMSQIVLSNWAVMA